MVLELGTFLTSKGKDMDFPQSPYLGWTLVGVVGVVGVVGGPLSIKGISCLRTSPDTWYNLFHIETKI